MSELGKYVLCPKCKGDKSENPCPTCGDEGRIMVRQICPLCADSGEVLHYKMSGGRKVCWSVPCPQCTAPPITFAKTSVRYATAYGHTAAVLDGNVNNMISNGWLPYRSPYIASNGYFYQAMTKEVPQ